MTARKFQRMRRFAQKLRATARHRSIKVASATI
jgi:hypothetical protein